MANIRAQDVQRNKKLDMFNKLVASKTKVNRSPRLKSITDRDLDKDSNMISKKFSKMLSFKPEKVSTPTEVLDVGISESGMSSQVVYGGDIQSGTKVKKMRRIGPSGGSNGGLLSLLTGQNKTFASMYTKNAELMTKMHSESMSATLKMANLQSKHMQSMSESLAKMAQIKSTVQVEYYKNNLETQNSILKELQEINRNIRTGFNINEKGKVEIDKKQESMIRDLFSGGNMRAKGKNMLVHLAKAYGDSKSGGGASMLSSILPMMGSMFEMGGTPALMSMMIQGGLTKGTKSLGNKFLNPRKGRQLNNLINDPGQFFEVMMNNWAAMDPNGIKGFIGKNLGSGKNKISTVDLSKYLTKDKDDRANFDGAAHTSLTKVIPSLLTKIHSSVSGLPEMHYNYQTKRFESLKEGERLLKSGASNELKKQMKMIEKQFTGYSYKKNGKDEYQSGIFSILNAETLANNANGNLVLTLIKTRGKQLSDGFIKLISYFAQNNQDPGEMLDQANFSIEFLADILYNIDGKNVKMDQQKYDGASAFKTFLEVFRDLDDEQAKNAWKELMNQADRSREAMSKSIDVALKEAEGSTAAFSSFSYGVKRDDKGRTRARTSEEQYEEFIKNRSEDIYSMMAGHTIDLSGVASPEDLKRRIKDEYNKMVAPLFVGDVNKIKAKLKAKSAQLKRENHAFAPMMAKLADSFTKGGELFGQDVDYAELAGVNTWEDLMDKKAPKFEPMGVSDGIEQAKGIAKWHLQNNPKMRAATGIGGMAAFGGLVKVMAEKSGMSGPLGSTMLGTFAAFSLGASGRLTRMMDMMGDEGNEKMTRKDGTESNVTKREAMTEAMYREFLPKAWGMNTGMKIGGWVRNNVRFGPILGPVVGLTSGLILAKTSGWVLKVAGAFGKMGKGLLNWAGKKVTGDKDVNWGDSIRDMLRERMGLPPIGSDTFTLKEVLKSNKDKSTNLIDTVTGRRETDTLAYKNKLNDLKKRDLQAYYREVRRMAGYDNTNKVANTNIQEMNYDSIIDDSNEDLYDDTGYKVQKEDNVLNVRVLGGHLDAIGAIGALDTESYKERLKEMKKTADKDSGGDPVTKAALKDTMTKAEIFIKNNKVTKEQEKRQNIQEMTEDANKKSLEIIAANATGTGEGEQKEKKSSWLTGLLGLMGGLPALGGLLTAAMPLIASVAGGAALAAFGPKIVDGAVKGWNNLGDTFYGKKKDGEIMPLGDGKTSFAIDTFRAGKFFANSRVGKGIGKVVGGTIGKTLKSADKVAGKATEWGINTFGKKGIDALSSGAGGALGDTAIKFIDDVGEKGLASAFGGAVTDGGGKIVNKTLDKTKGIMLKTIDGLKGLFSKVPVLNKVASKADDILSGAKKVFTEAFEKIAPKLAMEGGEKAAKGGLKGGLKNLLTIGGVTAVLNLGFIAWDFYQGMKEAEKFFSISEDDKPTLLQRLASGLTYGILSAIESIPGCFIVAAVLSAIDSAMQWLCRKIYGILDGILDTIGLGDNEDEEMDMRILEGGLDKGATEGWTANEIREDRKKAETQQAANQQVSEKVKEMQANGVSDWKIELGKTGIGKMGGSGGDSRTMMNGRAATGITPSFYNQNNFPAYKMGSMNLQDDGCSLAVMKMISEYQGKPIPDIVLISRMRNHVLPNQTVSIQYFAEFGGQLTKSSQDVTNALKAPGSAIAILTRNGSTAHFIAVINRDRSTVWVGDPLKDDWEIMSANDGKITGYMMGAAVFSSTAVVTGLNLPKQGGSGAPKKHTGGFGGQYTKNTFSYKSPWNFNRKQDQAGHQSNVPEYYSKYMEQFKNQGLVQATPTLAAGTAGSYVGGSAFEKILSVVSKGEFDIDNPKDPTVLGRSSTDTGHSLSYGIPGMNTRTGSMKSFMDMYGAKLGLSGDPTSPAFREQFKKVANQNPQAMFEAQAGWLQNKYFTRYMKNGSIKAGLEPFIGPLASDLGIQAYLMDMTIQKGKVDKYLNAIRGMNPDQAFNTMRKMEMDSMGAEFRKALGDRTASAKGLQNRIDKRAKAYNALKGQGGAGGKKALQKLNLGGGAGGYVDMITKKEQSAREQNMRNPGKINVHTGQVNTRQQAVKTLPRSATREDAPDNQLQRTLAKEIKALQQGYPKWLAIAMGEDNHIGGRKYASNDQPWCHYFVTWCFRTAGYSVAMNGSSQDPIRNSDWIKIKDPLPGCVIVLSKNGGGNKNDPDGAVRGHSMFYIGPHTGGRSESWYVATGNNRNKHGQSCVRVKDYSLADSGGKSFVGFFIPKVALADMEKAAGRKATEIKKTDTSNLTSTDGGGTEGVVEGAATAAAATPSRGTSTKFGGWFKADGSQVFFDFGNNGATAGTDPNSAQAASGTETMGGTGSAVPGYTDKGKVVDPISVPKDSRPYKAAQKAVANASGKPVGLCAKYVRIALEAAGYSINRKASAYMYHTEGVMAQAGFTQISVASKPQIGDVLVWGATKKHVHGHIQIYCGSLSGKGAGWVSDFKQNTHLAWSDYGEVWLYRDSQYLGQANTSGVGQIKTDANTGKDTMKTTGGKEMGATKPQDDKATNQRAQADMAKAAIKEFKASTGARSASTWVKENNAHRIAQQKYQEQRNDTMKKSLFGIADISYTPSDRNTAKILSTAAGYAQDSPTGKAGMDGILGLLGKLVDVTVQNKQATTEMINETKKQTEVVKSNVAATQNVAEITEKKASGGNVTINQASTAAEMIDQFKYIMNDEIEMFKGLTN